MKKIYTLLSALLLVAISAGAATVRDFGQMKLSDEGKMKLEAKMIESAVSADELANLPGMKYTYTDNKGVVWNLNFSLLADDYWYNYLVNGDGSDLTWDDFPFYMVQFIIYNNEDKRTYIPSMLSWPCRAIFEDVDPSSEEGMQVISIDDMIANGYCSFLENGSVGYSSDIDKFLFLSGTFMGGCTVDGASWYTNYEKESTIDVSSFQADDQSVSAKCTFNFMNAKTPSESSKSSSKRLTYDGPAQVLGFQHIDYNKTVTELHIFNVREFDNTTTDLFNEDLTFGPFTEYYIVGCCEGTTLVITDNATKFDPTKLKYKNTGNATELNCFYGPVFSPANEQPFGTWTCLDISYEWNEEWEVNLDTTEPKAYSFLPSGYNDEIFFWCVNPMQDPKGLAFYWVKDSYYYYPTNGAYISNGTTDGFVVSGNDSYGDTYTATYKGKITYYPNPNNLAETQQLDSVGDINGVEEVAVESNAPVVYYNLQGMEVKNPAEGQLLIKKQGAKATKVIF